MGILSPRTPHQAPGALHPKSSLTLGPLAPHKYRDPCTPRGLRTLVSLRAPGPLLPRSLAPREPVGPVQSTRPSAAKGPAWGALPLAKATLGAALVSCLFPAPTLSLSGSQGPSRACPLAPREAGSWTRRRLCLMGAQRWARWLDLGGQTLPGTCGRRLTGGGFPCRFLCQERGF